MDFSDEALAKLRETGIRRWLPGPARDGAWAMAPVLVSYLPFGLAVGTAIGASDNRWAAWLGTSTIYGGAAHLAVLDLLGRGAGWLSAAMVGVLVNLRLAAYAAAMAPDWRTARLRTRFLAAVMLTDAVWALGRTRPDERGFYLGAATTLFVGWPTMVTAGMLLGGWLSALAVTGLLPALTLGAVVVTRLRTRPVVLAAGASAVVALATAAQPSGAALLLCVAVGVAAAGGRRP